MFLCIIQTNSVFLFPRLVPCCDKPGLMTGGSHVMMTSGKAPAKRMCVCRGSSDLQAPCTGQQGPGVAWQVAQPAPYPRADASDTAGRKE